LDKIHTKKSMDRTSSY